MAYTVSQYIKLNKYLSLSITIWNDIYILIQRLTYNLQQNFIPNL